MSKELSTYEAMGGTYTEVDDILYPNIGMDDTDISITLYRKKLTDLYLDEGISKEAYDEKYEDLSVKIQKSRENIEILQANVSNQKDVGKRMASLKKALSDGNILEEFDRVVFESIVEKVIVGETNDDGRD